MKKQDLIGKRFGMLTVIEDSGKRSGSSILWRCTCDCGGEILAVRHQLVSGQVRNCGCVPEEPRKRVTDLIGQRYGKLTVLADSGQRTKGGSILWRCRCDCGREILAQRHQLQSGNVASCGCVPRQYTPKNQAENLTGRTFGELTVLRRTDNDKHGRVCWLCRCSCGKEISVTAAHLKNGHTKSCGCKRYDSSYEKRDLTGQRFGRLTVLYPVERDTERNRLYWHCRCDCGNEIDVFPGSLLRGMTQSCGCWNKEQSAKMHDHMHYQDGTCAEILKRIRDDTGKKKNKAGFRGLFQLANGKYRASITFQGKHYNLGHYDKYADAVQARLAAEEVLHDGYLKALENYEERAKQDPDWADHHPFYYNVSRVNGEFQVSTNGNERE